MVVSVTLGSMLYTFIQQNTTAELKPVEYIYIYIYIMYQFVLYIDGSKYMKIYICLSVCQSKYMSLLAGVFYPNCLMVMKMLNCLWQFIGLYFKLEF